MRKWMFVLLAVMIAMPLSSDLYAASKKKKKKGATAAALPAPKKVSAYDKLLKGKNVVTSKSDFITLHKVGNKLYFEIPLKYMEREILLASTVTNVTSPEFCDIGYKANSPLHLKFTKRDSSIFLRYVSSSATTDNLQKAMSSVYGDPILYSYDVKAYNADSSAVVIDMSTLFTTNVKDLGFFADAMMGGMVKISSSFKKEASYLDEIKAFDDNLSVKTVMSYGVSLSVMGMMKLMDDYPFTATVTRSILLLPEDKMRPRISDSRVGIFNSNKLRLSITKEDAIGSYSVAHRWRIEPKDVEAYKRGELVEPVKPIVFYVDDAFPELWKEPIRQAVTTWNIAFEKIGFKNVMVAKDFPKDDPDFDPDNLKYSCIRYVPNSTANAMGPSWTDPTTGEIINASVLVYGNIIQLINNWRFVQTAQLDPSVRTKKLPDDVVQASLIYVVAHEVGHCLGFMHNMASSAAFPVDSLRSATFTQKYGTTPSIMDYARFNYVAQPGDKGVKLTPPNLGVYDEFLIKWNYRYVPDARDEWDEQAIVEKWVDEKAGDPIYRYGRQQIQVRYDPSAIEEDLGDDPVKASDYGVKNLKYILSNLKGWINDDADYSHRQTLYGQIMNQYYRYLRNVMYNVGGIYLTEVKEGTPGKRYEAVPKARQKASLAWVLKQFKDSDWLNNTELKQHFPLHVDGSAIVRDRVAKDLRGLTSNVILSSHVANSPYTVNEFMTDLYNGTWNNLLQGRSLTQGDKILQQAMVDMFCESLSDGAGKKSASPFGFASSVDEIVAYGLDESGLIGRFADQFRTVDEEYGRGYVASRMIENQFGTPGYGWQRAVNVSAIDDSKAYMQDMAIKSRNLLKSKIGGTSGSAKVHYQSLLIKLNNALKDKL
ncbi:zinc-dependent metalloprotease [uncultured Butyricimonas sp.]|uniref:zinc-dependent metalloprotease n=1 Tax=uncultured Butyricimonas sp. TaxID=1268785 RepID=UPI0026DBF00C|nr:zinc-dependent metalloprotease [uncultured Butyricimonas sp.]